MGSPIESGGPVAHVNNHYYYDVSRAGSVNADLYMGFNGLTAPSSTGDKCQCALELDVIINGKD